MYKIGIIGDRATVAGFIALGCTVYEADDAASAGEILETIAGKDADNGDGFAIIFIVDKYARELEEKMRKYSSRMMPAVTVLPDAVSGSGSLSYGMEQIKRHVEKAVGADILFRD